MIDLRSDTITQPTPAMREAIVKAQVGDDVFGDDPTVNALEWHSFQPRCHPVSVITRYPSQRCPNERLVACSESGSEGEFPSIGNRRS